ncbi:MAG TPA: GAF domain-containing protein, partial [Anaerolineales bacterium]|nr:GAF domain-containing protein [Anaerolineales bacterium]
VLEMLGQATHSSHVFLFENHVLEDGTEVTSQRYEWVAPGMKADLHNPLYQNMRLYTPSIQAWSEAMRTGEPYYGHRDILSAKEIELYTQEGLLSFINVPIFVGGKWWGLIGFDDYITPRVWTLVEVDAVKITASTLGSAIQRQIDMEALHRRDAILQAVNFAAQRFLQTKDWRQEIPAVLAHLGEAAEVSHVYIFEKHTLEDGTPVLSQRYEWVAPGATSELNDPDFQKVDVFGVESGPWYDALARGGVYQANLSNLPPEEKEHFRKHGFKTLIDASIMVENEWWGVIGFDDCFTLRTWSVAEVEAVKLAARTLTAAIQRQRNDEALSRRDAILQAATFAARSFLHLDWRQVIEQVLAHLGQATTSSHVFIFENFQNPVGQWVTSLQYEWTAPGVQPDIKKPLYQNVPLDADQNWFRTMASGQVYYANVHTLSPPEANVFRQQGLLSLINVPIFVGNSWWGNIGFDDYQHLRQWSSVEIDALQIAASTLGAAIQRQLSDEQLRLSELRHREELEQRVHERTQQLAEALREIENVSYTASHDLRAPVRAINGYASILLKEYAEALSQGEQDYLQKIERESNRMGNLLDDLIRLIQLNRQPIRLIAINLSDLATKAAGKLAQQFPNQPIEIDIHPEMSTYGDEEMLQTLMNELLDNAWKFTANRNPACITVGRKTTGTPAFYVQDNGIGFDMAYAHRLFRNFEQLHLPGTYAGTGMGLAIVQRIVQRHGGEVWAEGVPGLGATIYFTLPERKGTRENPRIPTSS